jgi:thiamine biosynthesis protein ThiS
VLGVLESLGFNPEGTVVERNADILDRASYATTALAEGDTVELVRFVGGG